MAKLNLYEDQNGKEYIVILTSSEFEKELATDFSELELISSVEINEDLTSWPCDRLLVQE